MRKGTAWPTNQDATVQPRPAARETDGERRPSSVTIACCSEPVLGAGGVVGHVETLADAGDGGGVGRLIEVEPEGADVTRRPRRLLAAPLEGAPQQEPTPDEGGDEHDGHGGQPGAGALVPHPFILKASTSWLWSGPRPRPRRRRGRGRRQGRRPWPAVGPDRRRQERRPAPPRPGRRPSSARPRP